MTYAAKIIANSTASGVPLTTMEVTFPRFILAEFNTHRVFSRNSASSRAIPVERRIAQVRENPFVPEAFTVNRRGMQATETLDDRDGSKARDVWLRARDAAVEQADALVSLGVHKQHANRLLEPFCWHTVVVTATEWENFFNLRTDKAAQPEMQIVAKMMREAYEESVPRELQEGEWHLPYLTDQDGREEPVVARPVHGDIVTGTGWRPYSTGEKIAVSVARCAAVSYERQNADKPFSEYKKRHDDLLAAGHMSPFEHQAKVSTSGEIENFLGMGASDAEPGSEGFIGNFRAPWLQYRKTLAGEDVWRPR